MPGAGVVVGVAVGVVVVGVVVVGVVVVGAVVVGIPYAGGQVTREMWLQTHIFTSNAVPGEQGRVAAGNPAADCWYVKQESAEFGS